MDFLTDENIATSVVRFLRSKNHSVKDVKEENLHGFGDMRLLEIAVKENRVVLTHDKDFANISYNRTIGHKGIIVIRLLDQCPENVIKKLDNLFETVSEGKLRNSVVIIREDYIEIEKR